MTALPALGYTDAWSAEVNGADAFTPLVLASQWAAELRLGTAIAAVYTRAPGVLAMTAAALADLAPGRFVLGIGTSSPVIVEQWNAVPFDRPYQRSRDMLRFLRAALSGQKVSERYETFAVDGFRLDGAPEVRRPGSRRAPPADDQAGRRGSGRRDHELALAGRRGQGPGGRRSRLELVARIFVCPTADAGWRGPSGGGPSPPT